MSKFVTGKELGETIYDVIWYAQKTLLIVCPFVKLDDHFKELFDRHQDNPKIHIMLVFGKNENSISKSLSRNDLDYFKKFLNISIIYVPNLHAKYYGNENRGVVTSINLYDYSFDNNIEFGVCSEHNSIIKFKNSYDDDAWNECIEIAENNEVIFIRRPVYEHKNWVVKTSKNYIKSNVLLDETEKFYGYSPQKANRSDKRLSDFDSELKLGASNAERPERKPVKLKDQKNGFCIRTGVKIDYNPNTPMSKDAWKVWNQYGDENFPEQYCHKTGEKSYGKTSMKNPVL